MIKRLTILMLTVMLVLSAASLAFSAASQEMNLSGAISAINPADKSITIKDEKGKEMTITGVDEKSLRELKTGDMVECTYTANGGKNIYKSIMKKAGEEKPAAPGYK
jgi:Cu/Ag efflux protein CusF